jgi:hypothetical protein
MVRDGAAQARSVPDQKARGMLRERTNRQSAGDAGRWQQRSDRLAVAAARTTAAEPLGPRSFIEEVFAVRP